MAFSRQRQLEEDSSTGQAESAQTTRYRENTTTRDRQHTNLRPPMLALLPSRDNLTEESPRTRVVARTRPSENRPHRAGDLATSTPRVIARTEAPQTCVFSFSRHSLLCACRYRDNAFWREMEAGSHLGAQIQPCVHLGTTTLCVHESQAHKMLSSQSTQHPGLKGG